MCRIIGYTLEENDNRVFLVADLLYRMSQINVFIAKNSISSKMRFMKYFWGYSVFAH